MLPTKSPTLSWLLPSFLALLCCSCQSKSAPAPTATIETLVTEFEHAEQELLAAWYPKVLDHEFGGYLTDFDADWQLDGPQRKMIVTQARHVWTASQLAMRYPENSSFLEIARHGYNFLKDVMWDAEHGGFFTLVSQAGEPVREEGYNAYKTAYGNAFGIYALAAFVQATEDPEALAFTQQAFQWIDTHSHDAEQLGYFQFLDRAGTPLKSGLNQTPPKDQNSSIHLLEAFTELYQAWPDPLVRSRLEEMLVLVRDIMVYDQSYLQLFFQQDWQPLSFRDSSVAVREANYNLDHVSVGHDIETAFLMLEAVHELDTPEEETLRIGKSMVDHALRVGWDNEAGGFYDHVYYLPGQTEATVIHDTKNWWAQAEGLNALLLMHKHFPDDENLYFEKFKLQWAFSKEYLIDHKRGGWYSGSLDKQPDRINSAKSGIWKGSYHTVRSIMHCLDMLEELQD